MQLDLEEKLDGMCDKCKSEIENDNTCTRCGKTTGKRENIEKEINKSFDEDMFKKMAGEI